MEKILEQLKGQLIVSCQAYPGEALYGSHIMTAMAIAAKDGGAAAIRANSPQDVAAIKEGCGLPVIGIWKRDYPGSDVYITPCLSDAELLFAAGADIVAVDATERVRPNGETLETLVSGVRKQPGRLLMADVSTLEEGIAAAALGFDLISTTLSGYTPYSPQSEAPDFHLLKELAAAVQVPVIAEGRIQNPEQAAEALQAGAFAVVVGTVITRPHSVTEQFVRTIRGAESAGNAR
ncbi:N-acetylmannosamine-6-phosphate 2-epimerase [Paenibacillus sp. Marseille-P2973]|uniref:N-acetylmannosamine-6-phosphate 2-epimerase n=1 Tax=Paenibacillus TaxID=44249 RepID=UPI001B3710C4|nr:MULTISPECIES: N-acetylmannosamine-6-phosphate 2-epimerase [Paenibacillus]MBQ4901913.1 N-acetylmannosamine-6-phosphate 2-epimerase [Paenibacillus sp. Marseille-P2973]MDN4068022.1 N-acetylmannosamine-6-phosphate 2-epimerase [Paenibacillus vini]